MSSLSHSVVFSISLHWLLRKTFLSVLAILWNSAFRCLYLSFLLCFSLLFSSQLFVRPPQTTILSFYVSFSWGWMFLITTSCTVLWTSTIVLQALCLRDLIPWIYLSFPLYNHKGFDLDDFNCLFIAYFSFAKFLAFDHFLDATWWKWRVWGLKLEKLASQPVIFIF